MTDNVELMRKWLEVFPEGEFEAFPGDVSADFVFRLPFPPPGVPSEICGREAVRDRLVSTSQGRSRLVISDIDIHQTDDPELLIATAKGEATMANGKLYRNSYVIFTRIRDGVVLEHTEYLNPLLVMEAASG
ncbi:MAG: nuclear transport factor 2 family protein [Novosphingobium sp.]|nr:nuclear transport factor 2 family protein [Novosphingobium sp.]MCP5400796.1 nuclear transport factor 2 family protein [Novosphingobium sp.]